MMTTLFCTFSMSIPCDDGGSKGLALAFMQGWMSAIMQRQAPAIVQAGAVGAGLLCRGRSGLHAVPVAAGSGDVPARLCGGRDRGYFGEFF
jgi:hypothetical protein